MDKKRSDLIRLFEMELEVLERGGYSQSVRDPHQAKSIFQYSIACINHWLVPDHPPDSCEGCVLLDFVPEELQTAEVPCHLIPLNEEGDTVDSLRQVGNQDRLVETVKDWLRSTIAQLKSESAEDSREPVRSDTDY